MDGSLTALAPKGAPGVPSIGLAPPSQSASTSTSQTVTATVKDGSGNPLPGVAVTFQVLSGPNAGQTGSGTTNTTGQTTFTVTSATAGMDSIQASFTDTTGALHTSNSVQATFTSGTTLISGLTVRDTTNAPKWSVQQNLQVGNVLYGDRSYTLTAAPTLVIGASWIRDANGSKTYTGNPLVTFSLSQQADVFVGLDKRDPRPAWLDATWSDTGVTETASNGPTYEVFRKTFPAGSVSLGPNSATGLTGVSTYTIAAR
jgi:hypothetical protein